MLLSDSRAITAVLVACLAGFGCSPKPQPAQNTDADTSLSEAAELSDIDGVSLKRLPPSLGGQVRARTLRIGPDGAFRAENTLFPIVSRFAEDAIVSSQADLPTDMYALEIKPPPPGVDAEQHFRSKLLELCEAAFDLRFSSVEQSRAAHVISKAESGLKDTVPSSESDRRGYGTRGVGMEFGSYTFDGLSAVISNKTGVLVLDETEDDTPYNFALPMDIFALEDVNEWRSALAAIGLSLEPAERVVRFTTIEHIARETQ